MDYNSKSGTIKNELNGVNEGISNIGGINFDSIWSGNVHNQLITDIKKVINDVNVNKTNLEQYTKALEILQQYKEVCEEIAALEAELASIPIYDDKELTIINAANAARRAYLQAKINKLTEKKKNLYDEVTSLLSTFTEISTEEVGIANNTESEKIIKSENNWNGPKLEPKKGHNDGPDAYETFYDLGMDQVVKNMETIYGYTNIEYKIRKDGVKTLSGVTPDGQRFEDLVMVAADVQHDAANPNGTFERGQIVETSLGTGIVVDCCGLAVEKRKANSGVHFDIATAWHTEPWSSQIYRDN